MPVQILMPALSPTMTEGNLVKWHKKEGESVEIGDILAEIETDKATMEVESVEEGTLGKIIIPEGSDDVAVNELIAILLEEGEDVSAMEAMTSGASSIESSVSAPKVSAAEQERKISKPDSNISQIDNIPSSKSRIFATPVAKRIAADKGLNLSTMQGSGPHGRIIKADVENAITFPTGLATELEKAPKISNNIIGETMAADELFPSYTKVKTNNMRKVIAKRLTEAKQTVPHFYLTIDCHIDALLKARLQMNDNVEKHEKISVNDFIIKAMACAMGDVPKANASWAGDHIKIYDRVDISVAVAIDGGLVTPILRGSELKSLGALSQEIKKLATRAREGSLKPQEFQGGTVSLSNLGMFGIKEFSAVINPPQGCILAVGAGEKRPIINNKGDISAATVMSCTLSVDHRVVDGAIGAQFLKAFKNYIENPVMMLK